MVWIIAAREDILQWVKKCAICQKIHHRAPFSKATNFANAHRMVETLHILVVHLILLYPLLLSFGQRPNNLLSVGKSYNKRWEGDIQLQ